MAAGGNWKEMFYAIEQKDLELVRYHLERGVDPNYQHPEFLAAPLIECIRLGHLEIAQLLLEKGANPAIREVFGNDTPLSVAKSRKDKAAVKLIESWLVD